MDALKPNQQFVDNYVKHAKALKQGRKEYAEQVKEYKNNPTPEAKTAIEQKSSELTKLREVTEEALTHIDKSSLADLVI